MKHIGSAGHNIILFTMTTIQIECADFRDWVIGINWTKNTNLTNVFLFKGQNLQKIMGRQLL